MSTQTDLTGFHFFTKDCIEGMTKDIPSGSIDVIVTSPPYNLGIKYSTYGDSIERSQYLDWTVKWATAALKCLKPDGSLFLNIAGSPSSPLLPHLVINLLVEEKKLFHLQNTIHWIKSIAMPDQHGIEKQRGHYKPINSARFVNDCHEHIFHLTPAGNTPLDRTAVGVPYADKSNISRWGHTEGVDLKCRGNTWFIPYKTITRRAKDRPHPATFPTELAVQCIKLHGKNGSSIVMDPFLGIGHSALAAAQCKVAGFIGFDIDSAYVDIANEELIEQNVKVKLH